MLAVYRLRWQIELAFKRLKSLLHMGKLRTKTEVGTRCWLYAHLIVALLGDALNQDFLESFPSGAFEAGAQSSLWRVAQVILTALIDAVVPPITLAMLRRPSPLLHKRLANPRRKRRQAVNYPNGRLS